MKKKTGKKKSAAKKKTIKAVKQITSKKSVKKPSCPKEQKTPKSNAAKDKPFTAHLPESITGRVSPETGEIPLNEYVEKIKNAKFDNDMGLRHLVKTYQKALGKENQTKALIVMLDKINKLINPESKFITQRHWDILQKAIKGDIETIQFLVRENPEVIYLPFVAKAMIEILDNYKHSSNLKTEDISCREQWERFLIPSRKNNPNPMPEKIMRYVFKTIEKEKGTNEAIRKTSELFECDRRTIKNKLGVKGRPGGPKKN